MTTVQPPAFATFFLERLTVGQTRDALVGDLIEQYAARQSRLWYWRQVLTAILVGAVRDIHAHKLLAVRALITACVAMYLFWVVTGPAWNSEWMRYALINLSAAVWGLPVRHSILHWWPALLAGPGAVCVGWIVGRLHRPHQGTVVLLTIATMEFFHFRRLYWLVGNALRGPGYGEALEIQLTIIFLTVAGLLIGGLWSAAPDRTVSLARGGIA